MQRVDLGAKRCAGSHRVYFEHGTETYDADCGPHQRKMDGVMRNRGFRVGEDWITRRFEGVDHPPRAWRARVHIPLKFLLGHRIEGDRGS